MYSYIDIASDGRVYGVYSGFSQAGRETTFLNPINAEHTVPQSWFNKRSPMRSDIHILFPTHKDVNSARGSLPFGDINDDQTDKWYGVASDTGSLQVLRNALPPLSSRDKYSEYEKNSTFEPPEQQKGDTARAIFYFYTMYPTQAGGIERIIKTGLLESLYQWHLEDPVVEPGQEPTTSWEWQRNVRIAEKQGNYNPYVIFPELICRAWEIRDCE
jgi:endonuclease I